MESISLLMVEEQEIYKQPSKLNFKNGLKN